MKRRTLLQAAPGLIASPSDGVRHTGTPLTAPTFKLGYGPIP